MEKEEKLATDISELHLPSDPTEPTPFANQSTTNFSQNLEN